jgi:hypothetical protein
LHDLLALLQSMQHSLRDPQFELDVPGWQFPDESQHPAQVPLPQEVLGLPVRHAPSGAELPEEPLDELLLDDEPLGDAGPETMHAPPGWQVPPRFAQLWHAAPPAPQEVSSVPGTQLPVASQQPEQEAPHPLPPSPP